MPLSVVSLDGDLHTALAGVPAAAGVGQILGHGGRNLLIGRAANLRRWAASHLGAGPPGRKGRRPPTNLRPVAASVASVVTASPFRQRLLYERLMERHVPASARRDLKPPAFLHLDASERFPRVTIRGLERGWAGLFGPFRNRKTAEKARSALHKLFPLRPCDYVFEPEPGLPLGLGCVYAQVRTCAAPCLARVAEEAYRALAAEAASFLAGGARRAPEAAGWLSPWVAAIAASQGLVVAEGREGLELYPVQGGVVIEDEAVRGREDDLPAMVDRLRWEAPAATGNDWPWLCAWLHDPRGRGTYLVVDDAVDAGGLLRAVRNALAGTARPVIT